MSLCARLSRRGRAAGRLVEEGREGVVAGLREDGETVRRWRDRIHLLRDREGVGRVVDFERGEEAEGHKVHKVLEGGNEIEGVRRRQGFGGWMLGPGFGRCLCRPFRYVDQLLGSFPVQRAM